MPTTSGELTKILWKITGVGDVSGYVMGADGREIFVYSDTDSFTRSGQTRITVVATDTGEQLRHFPPGLGMPYPNGEGRILGGSGVTRLIDTQTGSILREFNCVFREFTLHGSAMLCYATDSTSHQLVYRIVELATGKTLRELPICPKTSVAPDEIFLGYQYCASADGRFLAKCGTGIPAARIENLLTGEAICECELPVKPSGLFVYPVGQIFSPDGRFLLAKTDANTGIVWRTEDGKVQCQVKLNKDYRGGDPVWIADSLRFIANTGMKTLALFDALTGKKIATSPKVPGSRYSRASAQYFPDPRFADVPGGLWTLPQNAVSRPARRAEK